MLHVTNLLDNKCKISYLSIQPFDNECHIISDSNVGILLLLVEESLLNKRNENGVYMTIF